MRTLLLCTILAAVFGFPSSANAIVCVDACGTEPVYRPHNSWEPAVDREPQFALVGCASPRLIADLPPLDFEVALGASFVPCCGPDSAWVIEPVEPVTIGMVGLTVVVEAQPRSQQFEQYSTIVLTALTVLLLAAASSYYIRRHYHLRRE